jgi:Spy/CpxP family protein refolding chaperone
MRGYGNGMGPGMMGGYGNGYGMGPGMMGGYGMMGMGPIWMLNLSEEQQGKLGAIMDDMHKQQWALMGKMIEGRSWLRDVYAKDKPDPKQVGDAYAKLFEIQRQMIENGVAAHNRMFDILTKEQQEELQNLRRGGGGYGYGPRGTRGSMPYGGMMGGGMMGNQ